MCLQVTANFGRGPAAKVAEEDIYVYKMLCVQDERSARIHITSPYRGFVYWLNTPYKLNPVSRKAFNEPNEVKGPYLTTPYYYEVEEGFHCFTDVKHACRLTNHKNAHYNGANGEWFYLFVAVIPKGASYYEGIFPDFRAKSTVSDQLIVLDRNHPESLKRIGNLPSHLEK